MCLKKNTPAINRSAKINLNLNLFVKLKIKFNC